MHPANDEWQQLQTVMTMTRVSGQKQQLMYDISMPDQQVASVLGG